ncbi:MAG: DNA-directed RNA polymerase subunit omega [Thermacetogeniaceae bacterium]
MKDPSFDYLMEKVESKYELVVAAAKRARHLTETCTVGDNSSSQKPVTVALTEIAAGKLIIERPQQQSKIK